MQTDQAAAAAPGVTEDKMERSARGATWTLLVLFLVYVCNGIDRSVISVVFEPIKQEFVLSDGQLGLLATGFAVSYAFSGLFFGAAADRYSRRNLIAACLLFWSVAASLCGAARTFFHLLAARIGVGMGEAGAAPAAMSMLSDLYPSAQRARAISIYYLSAPIGFMLAFAAAGWLQQQFGWRLAFLLAAAPGFLLIPLLLLSVREPARGAMDVHGARDQPVPARAFLRFCGTQPALILLVVGATINVTVLAGVGAWIVSYFVRAHELSVAAAGASVGFLQGGFGIAGTLAGGFLADILGRRDPRARLWLVAGATLAGLLFILAGLLSPGATVALAFYGASAFAHSFWYGPIYGLGQELVRVRMRATMAAVVYLITNLGAGAGPAIIGFMSDHYERAMGASGLTPAMVTMSVVNLLAAGIFLWASRSLPACLARAKV